jgi:hypothetical protein
LLLDFAIVMVKRVCMCVCMVGQRVMAGKKKKG